VLAKSFEVQLSGVALLLPNRNRGSKDICIQIDAKRTQKKADAKNAWVAKHGDIEEDIDVSYITHNDMEGLKINDGREADVNDVHHEDFDDGAESQAEECSEGGDDVDLTEEDKKGIFKCLREVWATKRMEAQELLNDLKKMGRGKEENETPEDWAFGEE
jgi:hypothetical protein